MITTNNNSIYNVCKILSTNLKKLRPELQIKEYINEDFRSCTIDIIDKKISENSSKIGLGEFEAFMSLSYNEKNKEINTEIPIVLAIDKRKKDDNIRPPNSCKIITIHSHSGKYPVIHAHIDCYDNSKLAEIAEFINNITKINEKNTKI